MKVITVICSIFLTFSIFARRGGSEVGNGGDTIFCRSSALNDFEGHYTLDYLLEYQTHSGVLLDIDSFESYQKYIRTNLDRVYPEALAHFDDFFKSLDNGETFNRKWSRVQAGLRDIKDENIIRKIPRNCLSKDGKPVLIQTVIRTNSFGKIHYQFDKDILDYQRDNNPLQYSFFMMHEWMWDATRDVRILRKINWLFHSKEFATITRKEFLLKVELWKLFRPKLNYCHRSKATQAFYPKSCEEVNARELTSISELEYRDLDNDFLFPIGEFHGFGSVKSLVFENLDLNKTLGPRIFSPLYSLERLTLKDGRLRKLRYEVVRDMGNVNFLDLSGNVEFFLDNTACAHLKNLETLVVSKHFDLECLPKRIKSIILNAEPSLRFRSKLQLLKPDIVINTTYDF